MKQSTFPRFKKALPHFGLYIFTGLVAYAVIRLLLLDLGRPSWQATVFALIGMMILLEGLTRIGWLKLPKILTNSESP